MEITFWGTEVKNEEYIKPRGYCQLFKATNNYRKSQLKTHNCGTCEHIVRAEGNTKNYWKCKLLGISSSEATDIRKSYICNKHKIDK